MSHYIFYILDRGRRGHYCMVVGFTTARRTNAYHHQSCELESHSCGCVLYMNFFFIKFASDLRQVGGFLRVLWFPSPIKLSATILLKYC